WVDVAPAPGGHIAAITPRQPLNRPVERRAKLLRTGLDLARLPVVAPIRMVREYVLDHIRMQRPVAIEKRAELVGQDLAVEFTQPGNEEERLGPVAAHALIPGAQPVDR